MRTLQPEPRREPTRGSPFSSPAVPLKSRACQQSGVYASPGLVQSCTDEEDDGNRAGRWRGRKGGPRARLAGSTVPAGRDLGWPGRELRPVLGARHHGRAVPVRLARRRARVVPRAHAGADRSWSGTPTCPTCSRASSTAIASTGRTSPRPGIASTRTRSCSTRTPRRSRAPSAGATRCSAIRSATRARTSAVDERDNAHLAPLAAVIDPAFTWGDDRRPRTPWHQTVIYELHVKGFTQLHPGRARAPARHLRRAGHRGGHRAPQGSGRDRGRAAAGPPPLRRPASGREGADELLGLQHAGLLRARCALRRVARSDRRGPRVQDDGARAARRRHRGDPRRGLQPHRRGQPAGPDAVAARHRQRVLLPPGRRSSRATTWTSPAAATRSTC